MKFGYYLTAVVAFFMLPLAAEEDKPVEKGVQIRTIAAGFSGDIKRLHLQLGQDEFELVELETSKLSEPLDPGVREFTYGYKDANDAYHSWGTVKLPEVGRDFVLVFVPVILPDGGKYNACVIRMDGQEFLGNDLMIYNSTDFKINVTAGEASVAVSKNEQVLLRPKFKDGDHYYHANIEYEKDEKSTAINNTRWLVNPNVKSIVVVYFDQAVHNAPTYYSFSILAKE